MSSHQKQADEGVGRGPGVRPTRLVKVDYRAKLLMVKEFLTHKEYTRGGWKKWAR